MKFTDEEMKIIGRLVMHLGILAFVATVFVAVGSFLAIPFWLVLAACCAAGFFYPFKFSK
jgi:hypothetical protein